MVGSLVRRALLVSAPTDDPHNNVCELFGYYSVLYNFQSGPSPFMRIDYLDSKTSMLALWKA